MKTYSVWGPTITEADCVVEGKNQPSFADGTLDESSPHFHYLIEAESWDDAMMQYHKNQGWEPYVPMIGEHI